MIRRAFVRALSGAILTTLLGVKAWRLPEERLPEGNYVYTTVWERLPHAPKDYPATIAVHQKTSDFAYANLTVHQLAGAPPDEFANLYRLRSVLDGYL